MSARRKILMLTTQLGYGGAETSFVRLANLLAESMEVTVALFTRDYGAGAYAAGHAPLNAPILLLDDAAPHGQLRRWWQRLRRLRALKAQHTVTISFLSGANLVNVLAGYHARTVISLRGSRIYDPVAPRFTRLLFQYLLDPILFRYAARIVPVSAGLKNEIRDAAGKKALAKVRVIPPFVDVASLQISGAETIAANYAPLRGQKVIVAVGRLSIEKGFHHLIRVFHALAQRQPGIKLLLIGDGPMLPTLRALCTQYTLPMDNTNPGITSVIFTGYQKNVLPLMALGSVYTLTSATEGFPSVLLEAMAVGLPILAADTPWGARSILHPGQDDNRTPYPSLCATSCDYGTLMPRIDRVEYEDSWVTSLLDALSVKNPENPSYGLLRKKYEQLLADFDIAKIGTGWKILLAEMETV